MPKQPNAGKYHCHQLFCFRKKPGKKLEFADANSMPKQPNAGKYHCHLIIINSIYNLFVPY